MKNITFTDSKNRKWDYQIPFIIKCNVTGIEKMYTSEEYINGKIERFGGLDKLRETYVCRDAKKAQKVAKKSETGKAEIQVGDQTIEVVAAPVVKMEFKTEKPVPLTLSTTTPDSCYNPAFLLDGKSCAKCAFNSICSYKDTAEGKKNQKKRAK